MIYWILIGVFVANGEATRIANAVPGTNTELHYKTQVACEKDLKKHSKKFDELLKKEDSALQGYMLKCERKGGEGKPA